MLFDELTEERFDELVVGRNGHGVCLGAHGSAEPIGLSRRPGTQHPDCLVHGVPVVSPWVFVIYIV